MESFLILIAITYSVSLGLGFLLEKYLRMPWMFSALFLGIIISAFGLFTGPIESEPFQSLATLGMLVFLFIIGFNLDLKKMRELKKHLFIGTIFIIGLEGFFGSLLLYFVFPTEVSNSFLVALIASMSFATVGEAILLPILSEFKVVNTNFGQLTLGIGTLDDIIEVLILAFVPALSMFLPKGQVQGAPDTLSIISGLCGMFFLAFAMIKFGDKVKNVLKKNSHPHYTHLLLLLVIFFSFAALSGIFFEDLAAIGALLGGIVTRQLWPAEILAEDEKAIDFLGYIFLSPLFFLSLGAKVSLSSLFIYPTLVVFIWIVAKGSKLLGSFLLFHKLLGNKYSLLMGLGLSVRFSTSLIVQFILFKSGFISLALYSAFIATAVLMKPVIIGLYSWGLSKGKPP